MLICYDGWFPEVPRSLAMRGAEVLLHPTLTSTPDREEEVVLARSTIANQCYVINVNGSLDVERRPLRRRRSGGAHAVRGWLQERSISARFSTSTACGRCANAARGMNRCSGSSPSTGRGRLTPTIRGSVLAAAQR